MLDIAEYSAPERETSLTVDDERKSWKCYTLQQSMKTKFKKAGFEPAKVMSDGAHIYENIPFNCISIRSAKTSKRQGRKMSEEHKAKLLAGRKRGKQNQS